MDKNTVFLFFVLFFLFLFKTPQRLHTSLGGHFKVLTAINIIP